MSMTMPAKTPDALEDRPHTLYRFYDGAGVLLYVGITVNAGGRWQGHAWERSWWTEVATCKVEHFPNRKTARDAETRAIKTEAPVHNVQHKTPRPMTEEDRLRQLAVEGRLLFGDSDSLITPEILEEMLLERQRNAVSAA